MYERFSRRNTIKDGLNEAIVNESIKDNYKVLSDLMVIGHQE
jgi:hypothetical protein